VNASHVALSAIWSKQKYKTLQQDFYGSGMPDLVEIG
jgi:hypothetical protein